MMNAIVIFFRFLFSQKWKILLVGLVSLVFFAVLFPLSDLSDLVSSQVSKLTNNQVFVQLDKIHIHPLTTSVSFDKVYVETPQISSLASDQVEISPSISALLAKKPGGTLTAKGFLKGDVEISMHPVSSAKGDKSKFEVSASKISLKEARQVANINLPIKGELNLTSQAVADLTMTDQPELDLNLTILKFEMATTSVPLGNFGQISLPEIKLGKVELKGRLANGKFSIENGKLGTNKDPFFGEITGNLDLNFQNINGQFIPIIGGYNLSIDLKATPDFKEKAKLFLSFLDGYRTDTAGVSNYKFKLYANQMGAPPQFAPLR